MVCSGLPSVFDFRCPSGRSGGLTETSKEPNVWQTGSSFDANTANPKRRRQVARSPEKPSSARNAGEHFVMQPSEKRRAEKPRETKRKAVSAPAAAADIQRNTESGSPTRSAKMPLPDRTRRRQQTPVQATKEKWNEAM
jgi:hypothetical protein